MKILAATLLILLPIVPRHSVADDAHTLEHLLEQESPRKKRWLSPVIPVKAFVANHARSEDRFENEDGQVVVRKRLLLVTWFRGSGSSAFVYTVHDSGQVVDVREVHGWASQAMRARDLGETQTNTLRDLVRKLPESNATPPIHRTVHVSMRDGEKWRTETYDATALPEEFEAVMEVVGERFETRDRRIPATE